MPSSPKIKSTNIDNTGKSSADDFLTENKPKSFGLKSIAEPLPPSEPQKRSRRTLKVILGFIIVIIIALGGVAAVRATNLLDKIFVGSNHSLFGQVANIISSQTGSKLLGEKDGQINILLLGIGGVGHDGPYLSDTLIVAQIRPGDKKATLISIPRDYLVNTKELGQRKINAVFAETFSKDKNWEKAGNATLEVVEKISGLDIPYFAVVDFEGFKKTVNLLGGVEVNVERTFTDYTFPNNTGGYIPAVTFKEGVEVMNGERALIFARSRHAAGPEGTDFARSARQQKIIAASKAKLISLNLISDAGKINELFTIVGDHFHTNLSAGEMIRLYNIGKDLGSDQIASLSLDPTSNLICPEVLETNGAYVLTICPGKTSEDIADYFKNSFSTGQVTAEKATVWLADSSVAGKLYKKAEAELVNNGLTVYKVIYTGKPLTQSVVYPVNHKEATINLIKDQLNASEVSLAPPGIKIDPAKVDVIVILGENPQ
ncbi:LCP family protein [bacterium]|nr:MAG: LCP family protein [bacterium]